MVRAVGLGDGPGPIEHGRICGRKIRQRPPRLGSSAPEGEELSLGHCEVRASGRGSWKMNSGEDLPLLRGGDPSDSGLRGPLRGRGERQLGESRNRATRSSDDATPCR